MSAKNKRLTLIVGHDVVLRIDKGDSLTVIAKAYGVKKQVVGYIKGQALDYMLTFTDLILLVRIAKTDAFRYVMHNTGLFDNLIFLTFFVRMGCKKTDFDCFPESLNYFEIC